MNCSGESQSRGVANYFLQENKCVNQATSFGYSARLTYSGNTFTIETDVASGSTSNLIGNRDTGCGTRWEVVYTGGSVPDAEEHARLDGIVQKQKLYLFSNAMEMSNAWWIMTACMLLISTTFA